MNKHGCIQCYTGSGKGKSTSALGLAFRALGKNWNILIVQFLKGDETTDKSYGELNSAKMFKENLKIIQSHKVYKIVLENNKTDEDKRLVQEAWQKMVNEVYSNKYDLLILDEVFPAVQMKMIPKRQFFDFISDIRKRFPELELVMTGRIWTNSFFDRVKNLSDYFTDMRAVKHPYNKHCPICKRTFENRSNYCPNCGHVLETIPARDGIEY